MVKGTTYAYSIIKTKRYHLPNIANKQIANLARVQFMILFRHLLMLFMFTWLTCGELIKLQDCFVCCFCPS